jgi:hypothetical protein
MIIDESVEHHKKQFFPKYVTDDGKLIDVRLEQYAKQ